MKNIIILILCIPFILYSQSDYNVPLIKKEYENSKDIIYFTTISGIGMTTDFGVNNFYFLKNGVAFNYGLEFTYNKFEYLSLDLKAHTWIASIKKDKYFKEIAYNQINDDYYSQTGITTALRLNFPLDDFLNFALSYGYIIYTPHQDNRAAEFGYMLSYKIDNEMSISLNRYLYFGILSRGENFTSTPNSIYLTFNYKFKLEI